MSEVGIPPVQKHKCALCPYSTSFFPYFKSHMKTHSSEKPFKCPDCPYKSKRKYGVKNHLRNVHLPQSLTFLCSISGCNYVAKTKGKLGEHSKIHSDVRSFVCSYPDCSYSAKRKSTLVSHNRTHTGEKPYACHFETCSYAATTQSTLVNHTRIHTKEKPYKCKEEDCEFSTTQISILKQHQLTHQPKDGQERPSFQCPFCEYSTKYKTTISAHLKTHSLEKPFACSFESCDYRCKWKHSLAAHLKTHSEERQYKCELCPFRGKTSKTVKSHLNNIHTDPSFKPFKCPEPKCDYASKTKCRLNMHLLFHNGEKKYACSFPGCDYRAIQKGNVKDHELCIHSDEKKEKCTICEYKCKLKSTLVTHIRTHTKEKPFVCKESGCEYQATTSSHLKDHKKRRHANTS